MEKTFTVAGYSTLAGKTQIRFANSMGRAKVLARNGHTDIELQALPTAMTKDAVVSYLERSTAPVTGAVGTMAQVVSIYDLKESRLNMMRNVSQKLAKLDQRISEEAIEPEMLLGY